MNTRVSIKKTVALPIILCLLFAFQQTAFAQNNAAIMGAKALNKSTSNDYSASKDYKEIKENKGSTTRGEIKLPNGQKGNKMVYGFLNVNNEGIVMFDSGKGNDKLVNPKDRAPFRSVIQALNYLAQSDKWQVSHTYSLTTGSPNPAFILYHYEPIQ